MKLTKLTSLLLTATTLLTCITLSSCKNGTANTPADPFGDVPAASGTTKNPNDYQGDPQDWLDHLLENSDYDPNAPHGKLKLYGDITNSRFNDYNGMFIELTQNDIVYYSYEKPREFYKLCFDPVCKHETGTFMENCQASLNIYTNAPESPLPTPPRPVSMLIDEYDNAGSPVLYLSYKRCETYEINGVSKEREPDYCIERYDLSKGTRTVVVDGIKSTIAKLFTYGDYIYMVMADPSTWEQTICRIPKAGGEFEELQGQPGEAYLILAINDNKLYYLADSRYLSRCDLDLTNEERLLDIADLKGNMGENGKGIPGAIVGDYFYYFADFETVNYGEKCNCFRIPLNNLTVTPELIAENMINSLSQYRFDEDTLYYQPAVLEMVDASKFPHNIKNTDFTNDSNGTLFALNLNTLKRTTVCKNIGMNIDINAVFDDKISFTGCAYTADADVIKMANGTKNQVVVSKNGNEIEVWFSTQDRIEYIN